MATLNDVVSFVTSDVLRRTDTDTVAITRNAAVAVYKTVCGKIPFDELQAVTSEIPFQANVATYDLAPLIPALAGIMSIRVTINANSRRRLRRSHVRVYDALSFTKPSIPSTYARFGTSIEVNPPPDSSSYTYRVRYWSQPTMDVTPYTTTIVFQDPWVELLNYETLYRVYISLNQWDKALQLIQPPVVPRGGYSSKKLQLTEVGIIPRLWNDLLTTISQKENVDEDFNINPVIRPYSVRV